MTSRAKSPSRLKRNTEVPGQALGYGLQYTRLTLLLLQAPEGSFCSMEHLDDVAQQDSESGVLLIQSKSALTANPVADRAKALWKTLSNWILLAATPGFEVEKTIFEIYVSRPVTGTLIEGFSKAKTKEEARAAILLARSTLWGDAPDFRNKPEVAEEISQYVENVFTADQDLLERVIRNLQLTLGSGSPQADLESVIRSHPVSPSKVLDIADHLCGVVKRWVDKLLEAGAPAIVSRDEFHASYTAYSRKIDRDTVLLTRAKAPTEEESLGQLPKVFVQQLKVIGLSYDEMLEAVSDYLMAAADRTEWAIRGEVDETSFDDLDAALNRSWSHKRRACRLSHGDKPEQLQGQVIYSECMQLSMPLQAMSPPSHFIPGCLHRLADDLLIGWHPNFEKQFNVEKAA